MGVRGPDPFHPSVLKGTMESTGSCGPVSPTVVPYSPSITGAVAPKADIANPAFDLCYAATFNWGANVIRILKCLLVLTVGLNGLFCALQNVANFRQAKDALAYVISGSGHETYPHTLFFYSNSSALHWAALIVALVGEFAVGFFGLKGAWDLFAARNGTAKEFHAAKTAGVWAGGIALLTWFGLFVTIGGAFFEMWQTPMGSGSQDHAFDFAAISAITILFVYLTDD